MVGINSYYWLRPSGVTVRRCPICGDIPQIKQKKAKKGTGIRCVIVCRTLFKTHFRAEAEAGEWKKAYRYAAGKWNSVREREKLDDRRNQK